MIVAQLVKDCRRLRGPEDSLQFSQETTTELHPKAAELSSCSQILFLYGLFISYMY
jgi:hypothetical protein